MCDMYALVMRRIMVNTLQLWKRVCIMIVGKIKGKHLTMYM